jgi:hypothetical protein
MQIIIGIFVILHGLVHMWYVTLSQRWVEFQADMGWTGKSWLLSNLMGQSLVNNIATIFYGLATVLYLVVGIGLLAKQNWVQSWMIGASAFSILTIFIFWDGNFSLLVQKGLLGFLISAGFLIAALVFNWPAI